MIAFARNPLPVPDPRAVLAAQLAGAAQWAERAVVTAAAHEETDATMHVADLATLVLYARQAAIALDRGAVP